MNPLTLEWVEKAEGDLRTARREYGARIAPNYGYPGFSADKREAKEALSAAERICSFTRKKLSI